MQIFFMNFCLLAIIAQIHFISANSLKIPFPTLCEEKAGFFAAYLFCFSPFACLRRFLRFPVIFCVFTKKALFCVSHLLLAQDIV